MKESGRRNSEPLRLRFLTKPLSDQDLLEAIRITLERHRIGNEQQQQMAELRKRFESLTPQSGK